MKRLGVCWLGAALVCAVIGLGWTAPSLAAPQGKIVIAQGVDPTTLDPQWHEETPAYNVLLNIYDTLLFRDKDLKIIPWLATSWKLVTPTTWEFKLRQGVRFHNGEAFDADAVKFSIDRLRDPKLGNRQAGNFRLVTAVEVVDTFTVRIVTSKPFPTMENQLALRGAVMAPKHFAGKDKTFADRNPVGTGPYKFVRWAKDDQLVLEANDGWWGGAPKVKTIVYRPIPEHAVRVAALQGGEVDIAVNIPPHLVPIIDKHPKLYIMYLIGWGNTTWDADGTLTPLFRSGNPLANNHNPDFDGMMDEAQTTVDPKRRQEIYAKAQRLMLDDGAVLPLYQQMDLYGVNKRVGFQALSSEQIVGVWLSLKDGK
ncbi:MAG: hypothetical protein A2X52_12960 [Candidatus Rokubacteria bacterium GWC2_70_16]|nr:MAG: hypothetical protein A2X52_12960 [Candidatus Rokubacteria bacterium GWC2_70_16]